MRLYEEWSLFGKPPASLGASTVAMALASMVFDVPRFLSQTLVGAKIGGPQNGCLSV